MAIGENIPVTIGTVGGTGKAPNRGELDDRDQLDFGAELGAMLTTLNPLHVLAPAASTSGTSNPGSVATPVKSITPQASIGESASVLADGQGATVEMAPPSVRAEQPAPFDTMASVFPVVTGMAAGTEAATPAHLTSTLTNTPDALSRIAETSATSAPDQPHEAVVIPRAANVQVHTEASHTASAPRIESAEAPENPLSAIAPEAKTQPAKSQPAKSQSPSLAAPKKTGEEASDQTAPADEQAGGNPPPPGLRSESATTTVTRDALEPVLTSKNSPQNLPPLTHLRGIAESRSAETGPANPVAKPDLSRIAPPAAVARIRPVTEVVAATGPARTAALKIDLANGATARASVRERAGAVEVRIVTDNSPVAQHLTEQIAGLRRALDATGLRLHSADVSYRSAGGEGRQGDPREQTPRRDETQGREVFAVEEIDR